MATYRECFRQDSLVAAAKGLDDQFAAHLAVVDSARTDFLAQVDAVQNVTVQGNPVSVSFSGALDQLGGALDAVLQAGKDRQSNLADDFFSEIQALPWSSMDDAESRLGAHGIHMLNGRGLVEEGINLVVPRDAFRSLNNDFALWRSQLELPVESLFVTMYADVSMVESGLDDCGNIGVLTSTVRKYAAVNSNAAAFAKANNIELSQVQVSVYWQGSAQATYSTVLMLRRIGLSDEQISAVVGEAGIPTFDGKLPSVTQFDGNPTIRTSAIIDEEILADSSEWFSDAELKTLMQRSLPLGVDLFGDGPSGPAFFDTVNRMLSAPSNKIGGLRPQAEQEQNTTNGVHPLLNPSLIIAGLIDPAGTLAFSGIVENSPCFVLADALGFSEITAFIFSTLQTVLDAVKAAAGVVAGAVAAVLNELATKAQAMLEMIGYGSIAYAALVCLLGIGPIGSGFADAFLDALIAAVDTVIATISAPFDALAALLAAINVPFCFSLSMLRELLGSDCLPDIGIPDALRDCLQENLDVVIGALSSITSTLAQIADEVKTLLAFIQNVLSGLQIGFQSTKGKCVSPASAATMSAVTAGFR